MGTLWSLHGRFKWLNLSRELLMSLSFIFDYKALVILATACESLSADSLWIQSTKKRKSLSAIRIMHRTASSFSHLHLCGYRGRKKRLCRVWIKMFHVILSSGSKLTVSAPTNLWDECARKYVAASTLAIRVFIIEPHVGRCRCYFFEVFYLQLYDSQTPQRSNFSSRSRSTLCGYAQEYSRVMSNSEWGEKEGEMRSNSESYNGEHRRESLAKSINWSSELGLDGGDKFGMKWST